MAGLKSRMVCITIRNDSDVINFWKYLRNHIEEASRATLRVGPIGIGHTNERYIGTVLHIGEIPGQISCVEIKKANSLFFGAFMYYLDEHFDDVIDKIEVITEYRHTTKEFRHSISFLSN